MVGGGSKIYGVEDYLSKQLAMKVVIPNDADLVSIIGAGKLVESGELLEKLKLQV